MRALLALALALMTLTMTACDSDDAEGDSGLQVTVVQGIELAPGDMKRASEPVARYLQDSAVIIFVSGFLYSSSCPPDAEAEADTEGGTVTLTLEQDNSNCTSDARRYTFLIQGDLGGDPTTLIVHEDGQADLELDLADPRTLRR